MPDEVCVYGVTTEAGMLLYCEPGFGFRTVVKASDNNCVKQIAKGAFTKA